MGLAQNATQIFAGEPVSRVLCPCVVSPRGDLTQGGSHSSWRHVAAPLQRPTRAAWVRNRPSGQAGPQPLFGLAPGGVCHAAPVASRAVRSCRTLSPLPCRLPDRRRSALCGTFPCPGPEGPEPAGVTRHPCFVEPGLSSPPDGSGVAAARLPGEAGHLARPVSRSNSSSNRMPPISPSISPSIYSGRQRRWNARTAARPSVMS